MESARIKAKRPCFTLIWNPVTLPSQLLVKGESKSALLAFPFHAGKSHTNKTEGINQKILKGKPQEQTQVLWNSSAFRKQAWVWDSSQPQNGKGKTFSKINHSRAHSFESSTDTWADLSHWIQEQSRWLGQSETEVLIFNIRIKDFHEPGDSAAVCPPSQKLLV